MEHHHSENGVAPSPNGSIWTIWTIWTIVAVGPPETLGYDGTLTLELAPAPDPA